MRDEVSRQTAGVRVDRAERRRRALAGPNREETLAVRCRPRARRTGPGTGSARRSAWPAGIRDAFELAAAGAVVEPGVRAQPEVPAVLGEGEDRRGVGQPRCVDGHTFDLRGSGAVGDAEEPSERPQPERAGWIFEQGFDLVRPVASGNGQDPQRRAGPLGLTRRVEAREPCGGSDPEGPVAGFDQRGDGPGRQAVQRAEVPESVPVEAREAVSGSQPEEAVRVGEDALDAVARQTSAVV